MSVNYPISNGGHNTNFINSLGWAGIQARDLDYVVFYEKPFRKFERILMTTLQEFPSSWKIFRVATVTWLADKLWIKSLIKEKAEMGQAKRVLDKLGIFGELLGFLWRRKLWWLISKIVILVIFGLILIFAQSSGVAPFIYTLLWGRDR